jgi:hypothetical protein
MPHDLRGLEEKMDKKVKNMKGILEGAAAETREYVSTLHSEFEQHDKKCKKERNEKVNHIF